jgi:hypothetical protein
MFPHTAIAAAAAIAARRAKEEEQMMTYAGNDLDGWEFKIVRSNFGRFSNLENVQKICREEAETGWELVEKFDPYRLRFKRRIEHRSRDNSARLDPYRTSPGSTVSGKSVAMFLGIILVAIGVVLFAVLGRDTDLRDMNPGLPIVVLAISALLILLLAFRKSGR